jgi:hypothetical protein
VDHTIHVHVGEVEGQLPRVDPAEVQNVADDREQMSLVEPDAPEIAR